MAHEIKWFQEERVFIVRLIGDFTHDDFTSLNTDVLAYVNSSKTIPVHGIIDDTQLGKVLVNFADVQKMLSVVFHPHIGYLIVVGPGNPIFNFIGLVVTRVGRIPYRRSASIEEALTYLYELDSTLSQSTNPDTL